MDRPYGSVAVKETDLESRRKPQSLLSKSKMLRLLPVLQSLVDELQGMAMEEEIHCSDSVWLNKLSTAEHPTFDDLGDEEMSVVVLPSRCNNEREMASLRCVCGRHQENQQLLIQIIQTLNTENEEIHHQLEGVKKEMDIACAHTVETMKKVSSQNKSLKARKVENFGIPKSQEQAQTMISPDHPVKSTITKNSNFETTREMISALYNAEFQLDAHHRQMNKLNHYVLTANKNGCSQNQGTRF